MKAFVLTLLALLPSLAAAEDAAFRDAFRAYVELRRLEEKTKISGQRADLDEFQREEVLQKTSAQLKEAKVAFERARGADLSPWEKGVLKNAGQPKKVDDKAALDFLSRNFAAAARGWSAMEWQCAGEWFGRDAQDSFLKITFGMEEASAAAAAGTGTLLWVSDPFSRFLSKDEATRDRAAREGRAEGLRKLGYRVEDFEVPAFSHLDEQAEELSLALESRLDKGPVTLVSAGQASAVLMRTFDLHPRLLANPRIRGWVNVNGKIFGDSFPVTRAPASVSRADRPLTEARLDLLPLREERLDPQTPLSPKFPVVNLVNFSGGNRPGTSLRDSLVPEGSSYYVGKGDATEQLGAALRFLKPRPASGQRDFTDEKNL